MRGASRNPVRVPCFYPSTLVAECHIELAGDLVGSLLQVMSVTAGGDAFLKENLVGLQTAAENKRPFANAFANRLKWLGGGMEKSRHSHSVRCSWNQSMGCVLPRYAAAGVLGDISGVESI